MECYLSIRGALPATVTIGESADAICISTTAESITRDVILFSSGTLRVQQYGQQLSVRGTILGIAQSRPYKRTAVLASRPATLEIAAVAIPETSGVPDEIEAGRTAEMVPELRTVLRFFD